MISSANRSTDFAPGVRDPGIRRAQLRRCCNSIAGSGAFDGAASGTPYRPNSRQVDKRLSFLVQRPVERHRQGTVSPQPTRSDAKVVNCVVETADVVGD